MADPSQTKPTIPYSHQTCNVIALANFFISTVRLGNSALKVSKIILGTMQYGSPDWAEWVLGEEKAFKHIKFAYDAGIQTFDTANVYSNGHSEIILGKAIKELKLPRDEIVIMRRW